MNTLKLLIKNQWQETMRSPMIHRNIIVNVIIGFFVLCLIAAFSLLGFFSDKILAKFYPDSDPVVILNGYLLFYFLADLVGRFIFDELPTLSMKPLLHLPISRKVMIHYILIRSKFSFFNWAPLLFLIPAAINVIHPAHGTIPTIAWIVSISLMIMVNNYFGAYIKRMLMHNMAIVAGAIATVALLGVAEYFDFIELSIISSTIWGAVLDFPAIATIFFAMLAGAYWLSYQMLYDNTYLEEIRSAKQSTAGEMKALGFLGGFGEVGQLIMLEIKLIARSKRPRTILIMGGFFLFYGAIFFPNPQYLESWWGMLMFAAIFTTGGFAISYAQYFFAWESSFYDGLLTQRIDLHKYITAKLLLTATPTVVAYTFSLLYGFIHLKLIGVLTAAMLFNIGVNLMMMMWVATFNNKRLNINQKATFNSQGLGITHFIAAIPAMGIPTGLVALFNYLEMPILGVSIIGILGIIGVLTHKIWIDLLVKRLVKQKYFMASGFRKQ